MAERIRPPSDMSLAEQVIPARESRRSSLPILPAAPSAVTVAVECLVALKREVDGLHGVAPVMHPAIGYDSTATVDPLAFAHACLPFLTFGNATTAALRVPTRQVMGRSWRWKPESVQAERGDELAEWLTDDARADRNSASIMNLPGWLNSFWLARTARPLPPKYSPRCARDSKTTCFPATT